MSRPQSPVPTSHTHHHQQQSPIVAGSAAAASSSAPRSDSQQQQQQQNAVVVPPGCSLHRNLIVIPPEPKTRWSLDDFEMLHNLGGGQYGRVSLATVKGTNYVVALKRLDIDAMAEYNIAVQLRREVEIAFHARHKHVLRTYGYFYDSQSVYLILEACANGMLFSKLHRVGKFPPRMAARYVAQLAEALLYLHTHHILHRDIKPENILLDHKNDIKLADFGWSVHDPKSRRKTMCGTPEYFPPEVIHHIPYDATADLWCLGIFCFEMLTGHTPFADKDPKQVYQKIIKGTYEMPECVPPDARDLIESLLVSNSSHRPHLRKVLTHPFLMQNYYNVEGTAPPQPRRNREH